VRRLTPQGDTDLRMLRLVNVLTLIAATAAVSGVGCAPEVLIARNDNGAGTGGSGVGGATPVSGTGSTDVSGTGDVPAAIGGEGGTTTVIVQAPRLLADSVVDWSQTQGERGWYYGFDTGAVDTFTEMPRKSFITQYMPASNDAWECWAGSAHWTQIFQLGAHPNGTETSTPSNMVLQRAVRRWVSTFEGNVTISGEIAKIDVVPGSNGVDAFVYVDGGMPIYSTFIGGEDGGGRAYKVIASLHVGSNVDFVLDPHEGDDHHDLSRFTGIVVRVDTGPGE
jgi:hypothetical protein